MVSKNLETSLVIISPVLEARFVGWDTRLMGMHSESGENQLQAAMSITDSVVAMQIVKIGGEVHEGIPPAPLPIRSTGIHRTKSSHHYAGDR
jgi:hypothetical protein